MVDQQNIMRRLYLVVLLASTLPTLAIAAVAPLRVVMDEHYPPFAYRDEDGQLQGYTVDLWRLWQRKTAIPVNIVAVNWADVQPMLEQGQADVIDPIFETPERVSSLDFSPPYMSVPTSIYADSSIAGIHNIASLQGFQVGVQADDACGEHLRNAGITSVRIYPSYDALMGAVARQDIKLLCLDDYSADFYLYRLRLHHRYVKAFEVVSTGLRRAVRKGDVATQARVESGMALITSAELDALHDKWMGRPLFSMLYARRLVIAFLALGGLILLLIMWLASVRRAVIVRTAELEREQAQLRTLVDGSPDLIWLKDATGVYQACNPQTAALFDRPRGSIVGRRDDELFEPQIAERYRRDDLTALQRGTAVTYEEVVTIPDTGMERVFETIKTAVRKPDGTILGVLGVARDITQRRAMEESMRMANLIYQTSAEAIVVTDESNHIVDANPAFTQLTGYGLASVIGKTPSLFESSMHDSDFYERVRQDLEANDHWQGEILDRNSNGTSTAKFVNIRLIRHPDGRVHRHVVQFQDISEQKKKDEEIWRQTNFDALTGLPNRRLFLDRLEQDMRKAHGRNGRLGVMLLDLDRFKDINDSLGHANGDAALIELTRRLSCCIPEDATVGRLGADSFGLIVTDYEHRRHLETIAQAILDAVAIPMPLGTDSLVYLSASVGIAVYPDDGADALELVRNAEHAERLAKRSGRGQFQYFTASLQQQAYANVKLINDLREALVRRELQLYYQPIVEVATDRVSKAEVLLRWIHASQGPVSPARFIPLAEESGLISEIGNWVLDEAIASSHRWRQRYGSVIELSVNISPKQFSHPDPLPWLERIVHAGLPPDSITIEITEGVLVNDAEQVVRCLDILHAAGAKASIDDFGTGFSSLAYLKQFKVDYLKIDKSFIDRLTENGNDRPVTESIIHLAHKLGIATIAEGVETDAQRELLAALGCDFIQGYYYSPAISRDAFEALLEQQIACTPNNESSTR
jgi:diguanylate cyclase (GGDEF)-like protein/PAS domain S-box-containing protein